jgi:hypothetical protein
MQKNQLKIITIGLAALLFTSLFATNNTALVKAEAVISSPTVSADLLDPAGGTQVISSTSNLENPTETPENTPDVVESPTAIETTDTCSTSSTETACVSTETTTISSIPEITDTVSSEAAESETPAGTETEEPSPTPTTPIDSNPPLIQFSTVDASAGTITIQITVSDESYLNVGSLVGKAIDESGSTQDCNFRGAAAEYSCDLSLNNGNYHIQVSAADIIGNLAMVDLPDFTVQINSVN